MLVLNKRIVSTVILFALSLFSMLPLAVAADDFPSKPIEVVIHSSYGGGTDTTALSRVFISIPKEKL